MYPEFIAIYIGLGVLAALLLVVIILLAVVLVKLRSRGKSTTYGNNNLVVCRNCSAQFNSAIRCCPNCGTVR